MGGEPVEFVAEVPRGRVRLEEVLPALWRLGDALSYAGARAEAREGREVSCRKGCGACCRQPVPVGPAEARRLSALVASLPVERRNAVLERFREARRRLGEAGLLAAFEPPGAATLEERRRLGLAYFALGIACPFLEHESCSIHGERPLACREYLVTSPAEECGRPGPENVRMVPVLAKLWTAAAALEAGGENRIPWTLLSLALSFAEDHPGSGPLGEGPVLVKEVFSRLVRPAV